MFLLKHKQLFEVVTINSSTTSRLISSNQQPRTQSDLTNLIKQKNNIPLKSSNKKPKHVNNKKQLINHSKFQLKEEERIKLVSPPDHENNPSRESFRQEIIQNEKAFLSRALFSLHTANLDSHASKCLDEIPSLKKSSIDPKHLTILHSSLASKIALELKTNESLSHDNLFIHLNPGSGLVSQHLIDSAANHANKYLLIESFNKFMPFLNDLKQKYSTREVHLVHDDPFGEKFLFRSAAKHKLNQLVEDETNVCVYGIVPWNSKGYLSRLFSDYASNRGLFQFKQMPTVYLYVPELLLAKLNPEMSRNFSAFNSSLTVLSHLFSKCKIVSEETSEFFYPYPQVSQLYKYSKHPLNRLDLKKLYLIKLNFNNEKTVFKSKRLFYLFLTQLFSRPSECVKNSMLKHVCKDLESVCKHVGLNQYSPVRKIQPYKFYTLFNYLVAHPDQLINNLSLDLVLMHKNTPHARSFEMKSIEYANKTLSGQFKLPNEMFKNEFKLVKSPHVMDDLDDLDLRNDLDLNYEEDDDEIEFDLKRNQRLT